MRVIIVEKRMLPDLQIEINNILKDCEPGDIFDVKYSGSGGLAFEHSTSYVQKYYSAMIIFK